MLRLHIHPENPQQRLLQQAMQFLHDDGIMIYPTDTCYAMGCKISNKQGVERIRQLLKLNDKAQFSILCQDLSQVSQYAEVDNAHFRALKASLPSEICFILPASKQVPKYLLNKTKMIGVRISPYPICTALVEQLNEPLLICDLNIADDILADPEDIALQFEKHCDVFLDSGYGLGMTSSVVRCDEQGIEVLYHGLGDVSAFTS